VGNSADGRHAADFAACQPVLPTIALEVPMRAWIAWMAAAAAPFAAAAQADAAGDALRQQVAATERAFARSMAERDPDAFAQFIAPEAVFFSGPAPLRGKQQVVAHWARFFATPAAPFSWEPAEVEVLESGTLALSSGPVRDPAGTLIGRFTSVWRLDAPGRWRIVFDKGAPACNCGEPQRPQ
jgi:ketosteroid isomerase-like protein